MLLINGTRLFGIYRLRSFSAVYGGSVTIEFLTSLLNLPTKFCIFVLLFPYWSCLISGRTREMVTRTLD